MWNKFKEWAESNVEVNCGWYYVLLAFFVGEAIWSVAQWLI